MLSDSEWNVYIGSCFDMRLQSVGAAYCFGTPHRTRAGATIVLGPYGTRLEAVAGLLKCAPFFVLAWPHVRFVQESDSRAATPLFSWGFDAASAIGDAELKATYGRLYETEQIALAEPIARDAARDLARSKSKSKLPSPQLGGGFS